MISTVTKLAERSAPESGQKYNRLSHDRWRFVSKNENITFYRKLCYKELGLHKSSTFWLKSAIRQNFKALPDGSLLSGETELRKFIIFNRKLLVYAEKYHSGTTIASWNQADIDNFLLSLLFSKSEPATRTKRAKGSKLISRKVFERYLLEVERIHRRYTQGLTDGFSLPVHRNRIMSVVKEKISEAGHDYGAWLEGGTWGRVPLEISMLLLQHCMSIMRSPETSLLVTMYTVANETGQAPYRCSLVPPLSRHLSFLVKNGQFMHEARPHPLTTIHKSHPELLVAVNEQLTKLSSQGCPLVEWPFQTALCYFEHFKRVYTACLIVFLTITGARWSELRKLTAKSIVRHTDDKYVFVSEIDKTNHGIETVRDITGIAAEATDLLLRLSTSDISTRDERLFTGQTLFARNLLKPTLWSLTETHTTTTSCIDRLFEEVMSKYPQFRGEHSVITPHQFRHSFAEFALRRFDGNVIAAIRDHFRHSVGSYMTKRYTERIVTEKDIPVSLNQEYIGELIMRYVRDKEMLHGPVGKFIKQRVQELDIKGIDEAQTLIEEFDGNLLVHEYGFCLMRWKTKSLSKCWNPSTATPEVSNANFELCSGCPNRLTLNCQKEDIERLGFSARGHLDFFSEAGIPLNEGYKEAMARTVTNAASALKDWSN